MLGASVQEAATPYADYCTRLHVETILERRRCQGAPRRWKAYLHLPPGHDTAWRQVCEGIQANVYELVAARQRPLPKIVDWFSSPPTEQDHLVFVYGSLLDPYSLARTIRKDPHAIEYVSALLVNHVSEWGAPSRRLNYSSPEWRSLDDVTWLWLTVRQTGNEGDVIPGALVKLRDSEFREVRAREAITTREQSRMTYGSTTAR